MEISFIHMQMSVHLHVNKTNFHVKGFVLGLALKQRQKATCKSPINKMAFIEHFLIMSHMWPKSFDLYSVVGALNTCFVFIVILGASFEFTRNSINFFFSFGLCSSSA